MTEKHYAIGIDIGGTHMSAVLWNGKKVIADSRLSTPKDDLNEFFVMISALIAPLTERAKNDGIKIAGIGLGIAGVQNEEKDTVLSSPNLPLVNNVKVANEIAKRTGLSTVMDNDARCFILAEATHGAGKKYKSIYGITLGTGIGGTWWNKKNVHSGSHNGAGEPSKMIIDFYNELGLEQAYQQIFQGNPAKFAEEAIRGDVLAQKKFDEFGKILGIAFANIVNIIDPEIFILGGGVSESLDLFISEIKKAMKKFIHSPESKEVSAVASKLAPHSGAIGAALLVI